MMSDEFAPGRARSGRPGRPPRELVRDEDARDEGVRASGGDRLVRKRNRTSDNFAIDTKLIPRGTSYEWKRRECYGKPDSSHMNNMMANHWKPVQAADHPELAHLASDSAPDGAIMNGGLVLCARPKYLTDEARQEDYDEAQQVIGNIRQRLSDTPDGTMPRKVARVRTEYEPLPELGGMDQEAVG